jgi:hypothetical protein
MTVINRLEIIWKEIDHSVLRNVMEFDLPCGLVVRVPGYRSRDPGLIPGATRFSEK